MDLTDIAVRLDADEKFRVQYRFPVRLASGEVDYETREGRLLDVAEEAKLVYVAHDGNVIWIKAEEIVDILPEAK